MICVLKSVPGDEGATVTSPFQTHCSWVQQCGHFLATFSKVACLEIHPLITLKVWGLENSDPAVFKHYFFSPTRKGVNYIIHSFSATTGSFLLIFIYLTNFGLPPNCRMASKSTLLWKTLSEFFFYPSGTPSTSSLLALSAFLFGILAVLVTEGRALGQ